jgi:hypothetical protein
MAFDLPALGSGVEHACNEGIKQLRKSLRKQTPEALAKIGVARINLVANQVYAGRYQRFFSNSKFHAWSDDHEFLECTPELAGDPRVLALLQDLAQLLTDGAWRHELARICPCSLLLNPDGNSFIVHTYVPDNAPYECSHVIHEGCITAIK